MANCSSRNGENAPLGKPELKCGHSQGGALALDVLLLGLVSFGFKSSPENIFYSIQAAFVSFLLFTTDIIILYIHSVIC